ncbi:hypothetical protein CL614_04665 [archaeon]|nr:hypothetical protein [archaeon]
MPDQDPNIIIDISGNTAELATDYNTSGTGLTGAHVQIFKLGYGDSDVTTRVSATDPFPVKLHGQTGPITVTGPISGTGQFPIANIGTDEGAGVSFQYIAIAGSTSGTSLVGVTGTIQGISNGFPLGVSGTVEITNSGIRVQGLSGGSTAEWDHGTSAGFGYPVAVTAGRKLHQDTDNVTVHGTVNATGGRNLGAATDAVAVYGYDAGKYVRSQLWKNDGVSAGWSGDALKVALTNVGVTCSVDVSACLGITNCTKTTDPEAVAGGLKVQGVSGGAPVVVRGDNGGAVEITATSALSTTVSGDVSVTNSTISDAITVESQPIISNLKSIDSNTSAIAGIRTDMLGGKIRAKITEMVRPSSINSGRITVSNTATTLQSNTKLLSGVHVKSSPTNAGNVLVGSSQLVSSVTQGYLLEPGESMFIECDNLNKVYARVSGNNSASQLLHYLGS